MTESGSAVGNRQRGHGVRSAMRLRAAVLVLTLALLTAACGGGGKIPGSGPTVVTTFHPSNPITFPGGAERLVLRVSAGLGGLEPYEYTLLSVPGLSVYGDGSAVVGAGRGVRSTSEVVSLERTSVSLTRLAEVLREADRAGLFRSGLSLDSPKVFDLPTDEVEVVTGDGHHRRLSAYALDFRDNDDQLSASTLRGRSALRRLLKEVEGLTRSARHQPYEPERYALLTDPVRVDDAKPAAGVPAPWPVGDLSAARPVEPTDQRCLVVEGADARQLRQLLSDRAVTNSQTWTAGPGGGLARVVIRPLLPDQRTCDR